MGVGSSEVYRAIEVHRVDTLWVPFVANIARLRIVPFAKRQWRLRAARVDAKGLYCMPHHRRCYASRSFLRNGCTLRTHFYGALRCSLLRYV